MTDIDMTGIERRWTADVPEDAQTRLVAAHPECRLLWNNRIKKFQLAYREPGLNMPFGDGEFLQGWGLIATFDPPLNVGLIIEEQRRREEFGRKFRTDLGVEKLEDYLDAVDKVLLDEDDPNSELVDRQTKEKVSAALDDFCSVFTPGVTKVGPLGEFGNSHDFTRRRLVRALDAPSRAHSGKFRPTLLVPSRRAPHRPALIIPNDFVSKGLVE